MSHRRAVDFDFKRWPLVSLRDNRSEAARANRPFGMAKWNPRDDDNRRIAEKLIEIRDAGVIEVQAENREWFGIGSRGYAYKLKARGFEFADHRVLTKADFERVERILVRMRRAGIINWEDVRDGRGIVNEPFACKNNRERIEQLAEWTNRLSHDRMIGQAIVPELVVEAKDLYYDIYDLADRYGARSTCNAGAASVAARYQLAQRTAERWRRGIQTRALGIPDHDKAGDETVGAVAADVAQHLRDMGIIDPDECLQVATVALTPWQIRNYDIPLAEKDGRRVQEAEALETNVLRAELEAALRATLDMDVFDRVAQEKAPEITRLSMKIPRLRP